jgi:hypothetical protein
VQSLQLHVCQEKYDDVSLAYLAKKQVLHPILVLGQPSLSSSSLNLQFWKH